MMKGAVMFHKVLGGEGDNVVVNEREQLSSYGITDNDISFFQKIGKPLKDVLNELIALANKPVFPEVEMAAKLENGFIKSLSLKQIKALIKYFDKEVINLVNTAFIPAAGAASRQFQLLKTVVTRPEFNECKAVQDYINVATSIVAEIDAKEEKNDEDKALLGLMKEVKSDLLNCWYGLVTHKFAFVDDLYDVLHKNGLSPYDLLRDQDVKTVFKFILDKEKGLMYEFLPKALLKFHTYGVGNNRTSTEEHIRLLIQLNKGAKNIYLHMPISEEHEEYFNAEIENIFAKPDIQLMLEKNGLKRENFKITTSFQEKYTDSVSYNILTKNVDRDKSGNVSLRKAGHGALRDNMNRLDVDGQWGNNIDNVPYDNPAINRLVIIYKKVMAALAQRLVAQSHSYIKQLIKAKERNIFSQKLFAEIRSFIKNDLTLDINEAIFDGKNSSQICDILITVLDRPIVVSGFVPLKKGQKGGGPFLIRKNFDGIEVYNSNTLEGSEFEGGQTNEIFATGDFFNPVNFYLANRRYDGTRFDLAKYNDPTRSFISEKTNFKGDPIKAYERPGLWNGSVANLIQVSIALPSNTFGAVKAIASEESFLSPLHNPGVVEVVTELDRFRKAVDSDELAAFLEGKEDNFIKKIFKRFF